MGEFRSLWIAELLSIAGDQLARVALAVLVFQRSSSAVLTALTYALTFVPALLGGALLSGLADRYPRRTVIVVVDLIRAVLAGAMALSFLPMPVLLGLVFVLTLAGAPFKAAQQALLPTVLGERYVTGLSLRTVTNQSAQLAGFLGGGLLLTAVGPRVAFVLNAGSFLLAAVVVAVGVRQRPIVRSDSDRAGARGAVRFIWRDRRLRGLTALSWLVGLFVVPEGLAAPYAARLSGAVVAVGLLMAADPAGSVLGAWAVNRIPPQLRAKLMVWLAMGAGLALMACAFGPGLAESILLWAIAGATSTAYLILAQASFTQQIPDHRRGAATGLVGTGVLTAQGIAILGAGALADMTSPTIAVAAAGAIGAVLALVLRTTWLRAPSPGHAALPGEALSASANTDVTSPGCRPPSAPPPAGAAVEHGMRGANAAIIARRRRHGERAWAPRQWALWTAPRRVVGFILMVEVITVALTIINASPDVGNVAWVRFGAIVGLGLAMGEMSRQVERVRRRFTDTPHVNVTSVWTFPAALLLPPPLTAGVVAALYVHLFWRSWYRVRGVHAYRLVYTACTVVLAAYTAGAVCRGFGFTPGDLVQWSHLASIGIVAMAIVAYSTVNSGLVAAAITLYERRLDLRQALGTGPDSALEYGTLGVGAATTALITLHPAWALVTVPALLVLHRSALVRQLEESASTDPKTGLTNATAWSSLAAGELHRAKQDKTSLGVLMVDLDRFKTVNDRFGHLAGDRVLEVVADALRSAVRRDDEVGRWGGEEFVVLCPQVTVEDLRLIGERICEQVRQLEIPAVGSDPGGIIGGLTVSIGAATYPEFGPDFHDLLLAADNALFVAKDNGRDQVQSIVAAIEGIPRDRAAT